MSSEPIRFKATEVATIAVATIAFLGSVVSAFYTYTSRNRELDIKLVEIGITILRADPKEAQTNGAREWAVSVIEKHSGQRFSEKAKSELLNYKLDFEPYWSPAGARAGQGSLPPSPPSSGSERPRPR